MQNNVTVHGRALARNGSLTLINDHFTKPTCATSLPTTTTSPGGTTAAPGGVTTSTGPGGGGGVTTSTTSPQGGGVTTTSLGLTVGIVGPPRTGVAPLPSGSFPWPAVLFASVAVTATTGVLARRRLQLRRAPRSRH
jgi:hypothetical protein